MELVKIESLLDLYFEGETTLEQERQLRQYFASEHVAPSVAMYQPMFQGLEAAKEEVSHRTIELPTKNKRPNWWYGVAASLVLAIGVGGFSYFNSNSLSSEEQQALAAYEEARATMMLLSENLNKGAESMAYLDEFSKGASHLSSLNEFTETKNRILK